MPHNAPLRGKNTFAKIVEGRKQQTYFCPALMACYNFLHDSAFTFTNLAKDGNL